MTMFRNTSIRVLAIFVVFVGYCYKIYLYIYIYINVKRNHSNGDCDETCGRILMRSTQSFVRLHHCPLIRGSNNVNSLLTVLAAFKHHGI